LQNLPSYIVINHGHETQSKLWKQIPQQAAGYYTRDFFESNLVLLYFII